MKPFYGDLSSETFTQKIFSEKEVSQASLRGLKRIRLNERQLCDFELLSCGGFSPLQGFMEEKDYRSVLEKQQLRSGLFWPIPIILDLHEKNWDEIKNESEIVLLHPYQEFVLGILQIKSAFRLDKALECKNIFETEDKLHPAIQYLKQCGEFAVGGPLKKVSPVPHFDFPDLRKTPLELRDYFEKNQLERVIAFQTRNPIHRAHFEMIRRAQETLEGHLLIHPVVGLTKEGDLEKDTRVRCYQQVLKKTRPNQATLSLLPLAMRMAGPREALWHMIIRRNYGCSHFIVGRDHAGPGKDSSGKPFYDPEKARKAATEFSKEIGMEVVPFKELVFSETLNDFCEAEKAPSSGRVLNVSGTELRDRLRSGAEIPSWFSFPEVVNELRQSHPPLSQQGLCLFFTGLSGAGKTTIARALMERMKALKSRPISFLDGDEVRMHLSKGLGFSKEDRDTNILRIGYVASLIVKHRGLAMVTAIAPYEEVREKVRSLCEEQGNFVLIHVSTPFETCENRDPKGLYEKARKGEIKNFTGLDDPYEVPQKPDLVLDSSQLRVPQAIDLVIEYLKKHELWHD